MRFPILSRTVLVVALAATGTAAAGSASAAPGTAATGSATPAATQGNAPVVEEQRGVVLEGSGSADGLDVMVTVYDNSLYGSSVQVVVGDPDDELFGYAEQATPYVVDGRLYATVTIDGEQATLEGTVVQSGKPQRIVESIQDAGQRIITRGTNTPLLADVTLTYGGVVVPLDFTTAFAYDLVVRRVTLYGG